MNKKLLFETSWHHKRWAKQNVAGRKTESELITLLADKHFLTFLQMKGFAKCTLMFFNTRELLYSPSHIQSAERSQGFNCLAQGHIKIYGHGKRLKFTSWFMLDAEMDKDCKLATPAKPHREHEPSHPTQSHLTINSVGRRIASIGPGRVCPVQKSPIQILVPNVKANDGS